MPYYTQINAERIVTAVTQTAGLIDRPDMIEVPSLDAEMVGQRHDEASGQFVPVPLPPPPRHITQLAFLNRFTDPEAIAIDLASIGATAQAAGMRRYLSKVQAATFIDLDRPDTRAGVQALEAAGVLAAGRALEILDTPIADAERPK